MFRSSFVLCRNASRLTNNLLHNRNGVVLRNCFISPVTCLPNKITYLKKYSTKINENLQNSTTEDNLVYSGLLKSQIIGVKIFSLSSSLMGLGLQPVMYQKMMEFGVTPLILGAATFVGFFTFVTPLLLHWITKKYVTDISYDPLTKKYTATLYTFFVRKKKIEFTPADIEVPDVLGMFTSMHIKGVPVFIEMSQFKDPTHYAIIMGYDKPININFTSSEQGEGVGKK